VIARVVITPKRGVLDPQGKAVCSSLHALGYDEVADVRVGKFIELRLDAAGDGVDSSERVRAMCERLLANGIIEDFQFELMDAGAALPGSEG
jgi:phosphoribosylformylglycinamidine synthase subunit PurS